MIYGVKNSIFSLRELEYRVKQDFIFRQIIGLTDVPDYSTFSIRVKNLENHIYYGIYAMVIELIDPDTRICTIDGTALRGSNTIVKLSLAKDINYIVLPLLQT